MGSGRAASTACSSIPRSHTPNGRKSCAASSSTGWRRPTWTMRPSSSPRSPRYAPRSATDGRSAGCRAVSTRRLPPHRPPGHRFAAHVRVRRHRSDAPGRGERAGRGDVPPPSAHRVDPRRRRRALPRPPGRCHRSRGEAQGDRRVVHPRLRGEHRRAHRRPSSCRARCTPTWSRAVAAMAPPPSSRATTTSAACPTTWTSNWSSRCAACSRTRSAAVGHELGLPDEIVWRQPFPGPGLAVRIIGEVTPERVAILQHADAIVARRDPSCRPRT